jgi:nuclear pore complex protein Nup53
VATVEYFRSLGENPTEADPHADIINAFRIGYKNTAEAVRAVRKNGEVLGGSWMIGVKWAVGSSVNFLSCYA